MARSPVTVAAIVQAHPNLRRVGGQHQGPCPLCRGRDRFHINLEPGDNGEPLMGCRQCGASYLELLGALGLDGGQRPEARRREWVCSGPDGDRTHYREDRPGADKRVWWAKGGPRPRRLLYRARPEGELTIVTEGEKDADAAAALLPEARVLGTVTGASGHPDRDLWPWAGIRKGDRVLCWPDADTGGRTHMDRIAADLRAAGADVGLVDPGRLGLTAKGAGAADWRPSDSLDVLDALLEAPILEKLNGRAGGDRAGDVAGDVAGDIAGVSPEPRIWRAFGEVAAGAMVPDAVIPGLVWRAMISLFVADSKMGKSTLIVQALAASVRGESFLGGVPEVGGRIAIVGEMQAELMRGWFVARGVEDADIDFVQPCTYDDLEGYIRERSPALLVCDTLIALSTANAADENSANDMRRLSNMLRGHGVSTLTSHHSKKSSASTYRGSGDIRAAVDMCVTMTQPEGGGTDRVIDYLGRWPVDSIRLSFTRETASYRSDAVDDLEGRILHAVSTYPGCSKYKALQSAGLGKGGRGYGAVNALIADGRVVLGDNRELYTVDQWQERAS